MSNYKDINDTNKCNHSGCLRKLKLTDYSCKCGYIYCKFHRLPEQHNCIYDYTDVNNKKKKIDELKCISSKIQKI